MGEACAGKGGMARKKNLVRLVDCFFCRRRNNAGAYSIRKLKPSGVVFERR